MCVCVCRRVYLCVNPVCLSVLVCVSVVRAYTGTYINMPRVDMFECSYVYICLGSIVEDFHFLRLVRVEGQGLLQTTWGLGIKEVK